MQISKEKIVSGIGSCLWEVVAYERWSHVEVRLYYAISGQGIEPLGALFGSIFPLFLVKLAGGWEIPCHSLAVLQVTVTSNCY